MLRRRVLDDSNRRSGRPLGNGSFWADGIVVPVLLALALGGWLWSGPKEAAPGNAVVGPDPGEAWVIFGADTIVAEVASTHAQRSQGLMDRESLPEGTGMLFVFPDTEIRAFWMKDTFIPLDVAFLNDQFTIVDIKQLEPENETPVESDAPSMFALEVNQGWFEAKGIAVGTQATIMFGPGLRIS